MSEIRDPMQGVVTTAALSDELSVRPESVLRWIKEGKLPGAFLSHGRYLIPAAEARRFATSYELEREGDFGEDGFEEDEIE